MGGERQVVEAPAVEPGRRQRREVGTAVWRRERHRAPDDLRIDVEARPEQRTAEPVPLERQQRLRLRLAQQQAQLGAEPRTGHGVDGSAGHRGARELVGARLGLEAEPGDVAGQPQQPRRVVTERAVVQHAQPAGFQVLPRAGVGHQLAVRQMQGDRVDREVAAREIVGQRGPELDIR